MTDTFTPFPAPMIAVVEGTRYDDDTGDEVFYIEWLVIGQLRTSDGIVLACADDNGYVQSIYEHAPLGDRPTRGPVRCTRRLMGIFPLDYQHPWKHECALEKRGLTE